MTHYIHADVIPGLRSIEAESVHCVVTSPPYWGLRNYGIEPSVWGGVQSCRHEWGETERGPRGDLLPLGESGVGRIGTRETQAGTNDGGKFCQECGAWLGALGLEPNPHLFIHHMVEVFRDVRRVLHSSGTPWLNMGDCYIANPHGSSPSYDPRYPGGRDRSEGGGANRSGETGLKSKDLVMMPARLAIALQEDGWYLRQQIPWIKRNGMPESCVDRPSSMVEYIYLFSKSETYFYDRTAILEPQAEHERTRRLREQARGLSTVYKIRRDDEAHGQNRPGGSGSAKSVAARQLLAQAGTRQRRNTDWFFESFRGLLTSPEGDPLAMLVNPQPFGLEMCACGEIYTRAESRKLPVDAATSKRVCGCGASEWLSHFATFPEAMVEPCVLAGTSEEGVCRHCGSPWERIVERPRLGDWNATPSHKLNGVNRMWMKEGKPRKASPEFTSLHTDTLGWQPTCDHPLFDCLTVPGVVLDPFGGSGTTALVAERHGRHSILIDRNANYLKMAKFRIEQQHLTAILKTPPPGAPTPSDAPGGSFQEAHA